MNAAEHRAVVHQATGMVSMQLGCSARDALARLRAKAFTDGITDILASRRPLSEYDQVVKDWQNNGGETIRQEYMKAIAAAQ